MPHPGETLRSTLELLGRPAEHGGPLRGQRRDALLAVLAVGLAERVFEPLFELTARCELLDDVGAAQQLSADEDLRNRRPPGDRRQFLSEGGVRAGCRLRSPGRLQAQRFERALRVPHMTKLGVPFMKSATGSFSMIS